MRDGNKEKRARGHKQRENLSKKKINRHRRMTVRDIKGEMIKKKSYSLWLRWTSSRRPTAARYWWSPCFYFYLIERSGEATTCAWFQSRPQNAREPPVAARLYIMMRFEVILTPPHTSHRLFARAVRRHDAWTHWHRGRGKLEKIIAERSLSID